MVPYPELLKIARVLPIYKNGDVNQFSHYKSILVLSCINTLFEKLVATRVIGFLTKYDILSDNQHGFRKGKSTDTAVLTIIQFINNALNSNKSAVSLFLDIKKAFDTVDHNILREITKIWLSRLFT